MSEQLLQLPKKPGTVIAIGEWWLIRLRPYEGAPSAWELLPHPSKAMQNMTEALGIKTQCVYGDEWVLAEAEQEGGYVIISDPRETPSGIQYFRHELAVATEPEPPIWDGLSKPPIGARVQLRDDMWMKRGTVVGIVGEAPSVGACVVEVRWDNLAPDSTFQVGTSMLEPEQPRNVVPNPGPAQPPTTGQRVTLAHDDGRVWHGTIIGWITPARVHVVWDHARQEEADVVEAEALRLEQAGAQYFDGATKHDWTGA